MTQTPHGLQPIINGSFNFAMTNEQVLALDYQTKVSVTWNLIVSLQFAHSFRDIDPQVYMELPAKYTYNMITPDTVDAIFVDARSMFEARHMLLKGLTNDRRFAQGISIAKAQKELSFGGFIHFKAYQVMGYLYQIGAWNNLDPKRVNAAIRQLEDAVPKFDMLNNCNNGMAKHYWTCTGEYLTMKFDHLRGADEREKYLTFYKNHWEPQGRAVEADSIRYELIEIENGDGAFSLEFIMWWD